MPGIFKLDHLVYIMVFLAFPKYGFQDDIDEITNDLPGGDDVMFPHHVGVVSDGSTWCGGTIVSQRFVLTAAHCLKSTHEVTIVLNSTKQLRTSKVVIHPKYQPHLLRNDVALIELPQPPRLPALSPIELHFKDEITTKRVATVYGWEKNNPEPFRSKQEAVIISEEDCAKYYGALITKHTVCTQIRNQGSSCHGFSGGGLVLDGLLVGVVSFGTEQCDVEYPIVYTKISRYKRWIERYVDV